MNRRELFSRIAALLVAPKVVPVPQVADFQHKDYLVAYAWHGDDDVTHVQDPNTVVFSSVTWQA